MGSKLLASVSYIETIFMNLLVYVFMCICVSIGRYLSISPHEYICIYEWLENLRKLPIHSILAQLSGYSAVVTPRHYKDTFIPIERCAQRFRDHYPYSYRSEERYHCPCYNKSLHVWSPLPSIMQSFRAELRHSPVSKNIENSVDKRPLGHPGVLMLSKFMDDIYDICYCMPSFTINHY